MRKFILIVMTILFSITIIKISWAQTPASSMPAPSATSYVYCNVYLTDACFGIGQGDTINMEIPVDFLLDTVHLQHGIKVVIYEGFHPEDAFVGKAPKNCPSKNGAYVCRYAKSPVQYDLLYQATANALIIHVHITGVTNGSQAVVMDFLSGFHQCHSSGQNKQCTNVRMFKDIDG